MPKTLTAGNIKLMERLSPALAESLNLNTDEHTIDVHALGPDFWEYTISGREGRPEIRCTRSELVIVLVADVDEWLDTVLFEDVVAIHVHESGASECIYKAPR